MADLEDGREFRCPQADHREHVHIPYNAGGILSPGLTLTYNSIGEDERVEADDV